MLFSEVEKSDIKSPEHITYITGELLCSNASHDQAEPLMSGSKEQIWQSVEGNISQYASSDVTKYLLL